MGERDNHWVEHEGKGYYFNNKWFRGGRMDSNNGLVHPRIVTDKKLMKILRRSFLANMQT